MPEHPWVCPRPFYLEGSTTGVLLLHGLSGSPAELRLLGEALHEQGLTVHAPALAGHGVSIEYLKRKSRHDWLRTARQGLAWLQETCERIVVGGLSTGALLAMELAREQTLDHLVLMAPAARVADPRIKYAPFIHPFISEIPEVERSRAGLTSTEGWKHLWHFSSRSTRAIAELYHLQKEAFDDRLLKAPVLIMQGRKDQTIDPLGAMDLQAHIGGELLWLEHSGHCLTVDVELEMVVERFASICLPNVEAGDEHS